MPARRAAGRRTRRPGVAAEASCRQKEYGSRPGPTTPVNGYLNPSLHGGDVLRSEGRRLGDIGEPIFDRLEYLRGDRLLDDFSHVLFHGTAKHEQEVLDIECVRIELGVRDQVNRFVPRSQFVLE